MKKPQEISSKTTSEASKKTSEASSSIGSTPKQPALTTNSSTSAHQGMPPPSLPKKGVTAKPTQSSAGTASLGATNSINALLKPKTIAISVNPNWHSTQFRKISGYSFATLCVLIAPPNTRPEDAPWCFEFRIDSINHSSTSPEPNVKNTIIPCNDRALLWNSEKSGRSRFYDAIVTSISQFKQRDTLNTLSIILRSKTSDSNLIYNSKYGYIELMQGKSYLLNLTFNIGSKIVQSVTGGNSPQIYLRVKSKTGAILNQFNIEAKPIWAVGVEKEPITGELLTDDEIQQITMARQAHQDPLLIAACIGTVKIDEIISSLENVNAVNSDGLTRLHLAAISNNALVVEKLLEANANVNAKAKNDMTPLSLAAYHGNISVMEILLRYGAFVDISVKGKSLLKWLEELNKSTALSVIKAAKDLIEAAEGNKIDNEIITNLLLCLKTGLNGRRVKDGNTALHLALEKNHSLAFSLIHHRTAVNIPNNNQTTVAELVKSGHVYCATLLKIYELENLYKYSKFPSRISEQDTNSASKLPITRVSMKDQKNVKSAHDIKTETDSHLSSVGAAAAASAATSNSRLIMTSSNSSSSSSAETSITFSVPELPTFKKLAEDILKLDEAANSKNKGNTPLSQESIDETFKIQSLSYLLGNMIAKNMHLFPELLSLTYSLLSLIKEGNPNFEQANALQLDLLRLASKDKKFHMQRNLDGKLILVVTENSSELDNRTSDKLIKDALVRHFICSGSANPEPQESIGKLMTEALDLSTPSSRAAIANIKACDLQFMLCLYTCIKSENAELEKTKTELEKTKNELFLLRKSMATPNETINQRPNAKRRKEQDGDVDSSFSSSKSKLESMITAKISTENGLTERISATLTATASASTPAIVTAASAVTYPVTSALNAKLGDTPPPPKRTKK